MAPWRGFSVWPPTQGRYVQLISQRLLTRPLNGAHGSDEQIFGVNEQVSGWGRSDEERRSALAQESKMKSLFITLACRTIAIASLLALMLFGTIIGAHAADNVCAAYKQQIR